MNYRFTIQAAILLLSLVMIIACDRTPKNIEDLSHKIRSVAYSEEDDIKIARIELDGVYSADEARFFFRASKEMHKILKKVARYFPNDLQQVNFVLKVRLQTVLGRSSDKVVMEVPFSMSELKKIKLFSSSSWDFLNRSDQIKYSHPIGRNIIRSFCAEKNYQRRAKQFCLASL